MKSHPLKLTAILLSFVSLIGCKKDSNENNADIFSYRIVSEKIYTEGVLDFTGTYEYSNDQVTKFNSTETYDSYSFKEDCLYEYPNQNKIILNWTDNDNGDIYEYITEIKLENNKIIEYIDLETKDVFSYNSLGLIEKYEWYVDEGEGWVLYASESYTYNSGKLTQIIEEGDGEYKSTYNYNDELISDVIVYEKNGETWINYEKELYTYTNSKITKIQEYNYSNDTWVIGGYIVYDYDSFGNLIEESYADFENDNDYKYIYTYEKGNGNFRQISVAFDHGWLSSNPMPSKKSKRIVKSNYNQKRISHLGFKRPSFL
jgi:hypothetical protein